jgi:hypothetical protein
MNFHANSGHETYAPRNRRDGSGTNTGEAHDSDDDLQNTLPYPEVPDFTILPNYNESGLYHPRVCYICY